MQIMYSETANKRMNVINKNQNHIIHKIYVANTIDYKACIEYVYLIIEMNGMRAFTFLFLFSIVRYRFTVHLYNIIYTINECVFSFQSYRNLIPRTSDCF